MGMPGSRIKGRTSEPQEKIKQISGKIIGNWKVQESARIQCIVERARAEAGAGAIVQKKDPT